MAHSVLQRLPEGGRRCLPLTEKVAGRHQGVEPDGRPDGEYSYCVGNESPVGNDQSNRDVILLQDGADGEHPCYE